MKDDNNLINIELPNQLTVGNVQEIKAKVDEAIHAGSAVCLDAKSLETSDTAGIQLLLALEKCGREGSLQVHLTHLQAPVASYAEAIGIPTETLSRA